MAGDTALHDAIRPAVAGSAFDRGEEQPVASSSLLWCTPTRTFRERHPDLPEALDLEHPDGCTDLIVAVDAEGRLEEARIEMLDVAPDLVGRPAADVLPELAARLRRMLSPS
jgi:hypothetical protein